MALDWDRLTGDMAKGERGHEAARSGDAVSRETVPAGKSAPEGKSPLRRCIVTREVLEKSQLIRFVLDPEGRVTPDLKGRLPGRGLWVKAEAEALQSAIKRNAFAKAAKLKEGAPRVDIPSDLFETVLGLMRREVAELVGLAAKSGQLVAGFEKVQAALRAGEVSLLIEAKDAAEDGRGKLARLAGSEVEICQPLTAADLSAALGRENAVHAAVRSSGIAERLAVACRKLARLAADHEVTTTSKTKN